MKYFNIIKISSELLVCVYFVEALLAMIRGSKECLIQHLVNMLSFVRLMNQFTIEISFLTQIADVLCRNVTKSFL